MLKAARYIGVPPWVLAEQSSYWRDLALVVESSENWAQNELVKRQRTKGRRR